LSRIELVRNRKLLNGPAALLTGRGFFLPVAKLGKLRVDLLALGEQYGDGLLLEGLGLFDSGHFNLLWVA
jgi:hypothetical protein